MSYPSKQTIVIFVSCALAVGGVAWYAYGGASTSSDAVIPSTNVDAYAADSALPGDSDWKSAFAGTSTPTMLSSSTKTAALDQNITLTDRLGRDFFSRFMDLQQSGLTSNSSLVNQTAADLVTADVGSIQPKTYAASDLKVIAASDSASLASFGKAFASLLNSFNAPDSGSSIMQEYFSSSDPAVLKGFDSIVAEHKRIMAGILLLPVPSALAGYDLGALNALSALETAARSLRNSDSDTVGGMAGVSLYGNASQNLVDALNGIQSALGNAGIAFPLNWEVLNTMLN